MRRFLVALLCAFSLGAQPPVVVRDAPALPSPETLKFPPLHPIEIPKPATFTLSNGLKIFLLENHDLPMVRGTLLVRTSSLFDPPEKRGLADLTGITMRSGGAGAFTGDQIDDRLESIAAAVETDIDESSGTASFRCMKENLDEVLSILHDVVTAPSFRQDKIDLAKTQLESGISRRNDDASGIASRELFRLVYGPTTPYGAMQEYATLDAISRADIESFYHRYFFPSNILMSVYGDFSTPDMEQKLEKLFGSWHAMEDKVPLFPRVDSMAAHGIYCVDKPEVEQTFLEFGELGGEYRDADYAALSVAADVLGGGFSSRLLRELRTRLGYVYDVNADWDADFDHPGIFRISCSTRTENTAQTIQALLRQIEAMRKREIDDDELTSAKDAALNSLVFAFERPASTLARLITYQYYGYPDDFLTRYQTEIAAVTKADVLRVARKYFVPENLTIVAVGNEKEFSRALASLKLPIRQLDVTIRTHD